MRLLSQDLIHQCCCIQGPLLFLFIWLLCFELVYILSYSFFILFHFIFLFLYILLLLLKFYTFLFFLWFFQLLYFLLLLFLFFFLSFLLQIFLLLLQAPPFLLLDFFSILQLLIFSQVYLAFLPRIGISSLSCFSSKDRYLK